MRPSAKDLAAALRDEVDGDVTLDAPLAGFTTFRVGGPADVLVEAETIDDLVAVGRLVTDEVPLAIVGRGSNLLVADEGFRGVAVRLGRAFREHEVLETGLRLGGAVHLPSAAKLTARHGLAGFEFAAEIPGTFGGAVRMNAGAHGRSIADVLVHATVVDLDGGRTEELDPDDLGYAYRHSNLRPRQIVVGGEIVLEPGDPDEVGERVSSYLAWRREHQPPGRSAGSVFKNPPDDSAGRLIDAAGLKGLRSGSAEVSSLHANFIVVDREGRAEDVWRLIVEVRRRVSEHAGVTLEPEVRFLGAFPQVGSESPDWSRPEVEG